MDLSDYKEPLPTEIEQIVDEARRDVGKGPAPRDPATGIADMTARIEYHTHLLEKLRAQPPTDAVRRCIAESEAQLVEARDRRAEYQVQQGGKN